MAWKWPFFKIECFKQRKHAVYKFIKVSSEVREKNHTFFLILLCLCLCLQMGYGHQSDCFNVEAYHLYFWTTWLLKIYYVNFCSVNNILYFCLTPHSTKFFTIMLIFFVVTIVFYQNRLASIFMSSLYEILSFNQIYYT